MGSSCEAGHGSPFSAGAKEPSMDAMPPSQSVSRSSDDALVDASFMANGANCITGPVIALAAANLRTRTWCIATIRAIRPASKGPCGATNREMHRSPMRFRPSSR